jgi:hypothetical protein
MNQTAKINPHYLIIYAASKKTHETIGASSFTAKEKAGTRLFTGSVCVCVFWRRVSKRC